MAGRTPLRFLAPIALVAFTVALVMVVSGGGDAPSQDSTPSATQGAPAASKSPRKHRRHAPRSYVIKAGDTPSGIAERTGVSLETLETLNPGLDPQALSPGERLKLSR